MPNLGQFWKQLSEVRLLLLKASQGMGEAHVHVLSPDPTTLIFYEEGIWTQSQMRFKNQLRWRRGEASISLEHLRYGPVVFLQEFLLNREGDFVAKEPHVCGKDVYEARLRRDAGAIYLDWKIGGSKNEEVKGVYVCL